MCEIKCNKANLSLLFIKLNHSDEDFDELDIKTRNSQNQDMVKKAYQAAPKISHAKYADLMELCKGATSVISRDCDKYFYASLPH